MERQRWKTPGEFGVHKSVECDTVSFQCSDAVGWATERASGLKCWVLGVGLLEVMISWGSGGLPPEKKINFALKIMQF